MSWAGVVHTFTPSTGEAEGSLVYRAEFQDSQSYTHKKNTSSLNKEINKSLMLFPGQWLES